MTKRIEAALREAQAELVRAKRHYIYRLGNGHTVTISRTASDHRWEQQVLRDIRREMSR